MARLDIADAAVGTPKRDSLVFGTLAADAASGVVLTTGDGALIAGSVAHLDSLEGLRVDVANLIEGTGGSVSCRHCSSAVDRINEDRRAFFVRIG